MLSHIIGEQYAPLCCWTFYVKKLILFYFLNDYWIDFRQTPKSAETWWRVCSLRRLQVKRRQRRRRRHQLRRLRRFQAPLMSVDHRTTPAESWELCRSGWNMSSEHEGNHLVTFKNLITLLTQWNGLKNLIFKAVLKFVAVRTIAN